MALGGETEDRPPPPPPPMDPLGDFTGMSPPVGDSQQRLSDSFASSLQCSADPNAFAGFHATASTNTDVAVAASTLAPRAASLGVKGAERGRLRLTLDLDAATGAATRGGLGFRPVSVSVSQLSPTNSQMQSSANPYHDIFGADTQDDGTARRFVAADAAGPSQEALKRPKNEQQTKKQSSNKRLRLPGGLGVRTNTATESDDAPPGTRAPSPPPTLLASMESARRARKQQSAGGTRGSRQANGVSGDDKRAQEVAVSEEQQFAVSPVGSEASKNGLWDPTTAQNGAQRPGSPGADHSLLGSSAFSDFSEDLAPHCFQGVQLSSSPSASTVNGLVRRQQTAHPSDVVVIEGDDSSAARSKAGDSERETCDDDLMESCTQPIEAYEAAVEAVEAATSDTAIQHTSARIAGSNAAADDSVFSDTGTQPYGPNATMSSDDTGDAGNNGKRNAVEELDTSQDERSHAPGQAGTHSSMQDEISRETCSSSVTYISTTDSKSHNASRESVESTGRRDHPDFLTPRASNVLSSEGAAGTGPDSAVAQTGADGTECDSQDSDEEDEGLEATQPNDSLYDAKMAQSPSEVASERQAAASSGAAAKSSSAIRNLEFSFTAPESEESETQLGGNISEITVASAKSPGPLDKNKNRDPFELSVSPVWPPTPNDPARQCPFGDNKAATPSAEPFSSKTQSSPGIVGESSSSIDATPPAKRKRKRTSLSPDANVKNSSDANPETPRPPVRRSTRFSQSSTPSSTPTLRPHPKLTSPVPTHRAYASRRGTLFTQKFEFCLTGFAKDGGKNLIKLIKGHGGKIAERYQEVLQKNNPKAVVIATPMAWRKRKFMQAVACGIPVMHPEWIRACIKAGSVVPFDGYHVPSGYSVTTKKFECLPVRELNIFAGYSFGIVGDASQVLPEEAKDKANLYAFLLKSCGASAVYKNLNPKATAQVDIVLCDEYTQTCRIYKKKRHVPVKDFQWVTECMILQRFLDPNDKTFEPQRVGRHDVLAASAKIGDTGNAVLKLHTGELVLADLSGNQVDHFLLFNVCEILGIRVDGHSESSSSQSKRRKDDDNCVMLHVGVSKRLPYSAGLSKSHSQVLDIPSSQVKRRVVAVSKDDFDCLAYRDESIFYFYEDVDDHNEKGDIENSTPRKTRLSQ